jgi:delta14-sterol reductase/lamin-B receptor
VLPAATLVLNGMERLPLEFIYDEYLTLITASVLFSFLLSVFVYAQSFIPGALLAEGGVSGNIIYDFFIGRELNPRIGSFDIKEFCELRPGLIGWLVINLGMATKQMQQTGSVSLSMVLINLFQGFYVWDALHAEKSILSTMDITTDGFGFMLAFGDLAWVPFIYSLQARYLVDHDPHLDVGTIGAILLLQCFGYYVFRAANSEKDTFRRDPSDPRVSHLTFLETKRGTRLITSGWWGLARKINYTGDWIMTLSWCLLCGWQSPVPYFQAVYFMILLVHRAIRDDKMCHEKYGDDWIEYKRRVPYAFIPYVI